MTWSWAGATRLLAWQFGSVILTVTGYTSQRLARLGIDCPTAQTSLVYLALSLHALPLLLRRRPVEGVVELNAEPDKLRMRWWHWLLVAAADLEANYLLVLAYQYTDIISVCLLDAFTIPTVMLLSFSCFGIRYSKQQLGAALLCILGIAALVASDVAAKGDGIENRGTEDESSDSGSGSGGGGGGGGGGRAWVGDVLVLLGAALYGCSNVAQEHLVRRLDSTYYLAHLGGFGFVIAACQTALLERDAVALAWAAVTNSSGLGSVGGSIGSAGGLEPPAGAGGSGTPGTSRIMEVAMLEAGFVAAMAGFYVLCAFLFGSGSSATLMNLSLLTSDFWAVLVGIGLLHSKPGPGYAAAFCLTISGLLIYHCSGAPDVAVSDRTSPARTGLAQPFISSADASSEQQHAQLRLAQPTDERSQRGSVQQTEDAVCTPPTAHQAAT